jgi:hypothetical protein
MKSQKNIGSPLPAEKKFLLFRDYLEESIRRYMIRLLSKVHFMDRKKQLYSMGEVQRMLKINREMLREWIKLGLVTPTIPSRGKSIPAYFSAEAVFEIITCQFLRKFGISRKTIKRLLKAEKPTYRMNDDD